MKNILQTFLILSFVLAACIGTTAAQSRNNSNLKASFDDPAKPGEVQVRWTRGDIYITGYDGNEVQADIIGGRRYIRRLSGRSYSRSDGLRKIYDGDAVEIEKRNNKIMIYSHSLFNNVDIEIKVPKKAAVYIVNQLNGDVEISGIKGDIEVETLNGDIEIKNSSGGIFAYSTNGEIYATINRLLSGKRFEFTTVNSDIDIEMPPGSKADFIMTTRDEIYTDLDMVPSGKSSVKFFSRNRSKQNYTLNGGGTDINIKSLHGNIYLRKGS